MGSGQTIRATEAGRPSALDLSGGLFLESFGIVADAHEDADAHAGHDHGGGAPSSSSSAHDSHDSHAGHAHGTRLARNPKFTEMTSIFLRLPITFSNLKYDFSF